MENNFFAMISRLKWIDRWALMKNATNENLSEHSLEVAMIAHALCVIGN
ncbi:MAG: 5'-deoxynucleotidase, partial [Lachnospiraceae bacterium]|nr:5'-deoxynucleotidase [Lachnospiraceae bacterium]